MPKTQLNLAHEASTLMCSVSTVRYSVNKDKVIAAPVIQNGLSDHLHVPSVSKGQFQFGLKTHLIQQAYNLLRTLYVPVYQTELDWTSLLAYRVLCGLLSLLGMNATYLCKPISCQLVTYCRQQQSFI